MGLRKVMLRVRVVQIFDLIDEVPDWAWWQAWLAMHELLPVTKIPEGKQPNQHENAYCRLQDHYRGIFVLVFLSLCFCVSGSRLPS